MTNASDAPMQSRQALARTKAVARVRLLATERSALTAKLGQKTPEWTGTVDALKLPSFLIPNNREGSESSIDAHWSRGLPSHAAALEMQGQGLDIQTHSPAPPFAYAHGREQNLGPVLSQHSPQPARALAHAEAAELRQAHRSRLCALANADRRRFSGTPVSES